MPGLRADHDGQRGRARGLSEEPHQYHLFLQCFEHVTQPLAEIGGGQVSGTAENHAFLVPLGEALEENGEDGPGVRPLGDGNAVGQAGHGRGRVGQLMAIQARVEHRAQVRDRLRLGGVRQVHRGLLHPAGVGDEHEQHPLRRERDELDVPHRRTGTATGTAPPPPAWSAGRAAAPCAPRPRPGCTAPARNVSIARRSAADIGLTDDSRSTNSRYPLSVGIRPALVCGWAMNPCSSSTAMSLRMVAGDTSRPCRSTRDFDPTGSVVDT